TDQIAILKAVTYQLQNGRLVAKESNNTPIKYVKRDINYRQFTFSLNEAPVGSVIEYEYTITGPMHTLLPTWEFTALQPKLSSEYEVTLPSGLTYQVLPQGYYSRPFFNYRSEREARAARSDFFNVVNKEGNYTTALWSASTLPALHNEQFISKIDNYVESITLQIDGNRWDHPDSLWKNLNDELWHSEHFGAIITGNDKEMKRLADSLTQHTTDTLAAAKAIFRYVRDRFENNNNPGIASRREPEQLMAHDNAGPAEINLILAGMLRQAGIAVSPVILARLGTKSVVYSQPSFQGFNYTVVRASVAGKNYFLDASNRFNAWDYLPIYCYNGQARVVDKKGYFIDLNNQLLTDRTANTINVTHITDSNMVVQGEERKGHIEANFLRNILTSDTGVLNKYIRKTFKPIFGEVELMYTAVENLFEPDTDLVVKYVLKVPVKKEGNKVLVGTDILKLFAKNPFVPESRVLPVYFPSSFHYYYDLRLDLPDNRMPTNVPASFTGAMPANELSFKHKVNLDVEKKRIIVQTEIGINTTNIPPTDYAYLKAFYQKMYNELGYEIALIPR
ncbi:MAG: transglutaminase domain-containing protein, partial [Chitinophagia bacterium]|nr:transglutaminase domain-containing protein [Chitinophagia bacterium]